MSIKNTPLEETTKGVIDEFEQHRLSLREAAQELGVDYWDLQEMLARQGIPVTDASEREVNESIEAAKLIARADKKSLK